MDNLKVEHYLKIILAVSLIAIISAYFIEYALGHQPCNLCLIERIPYALSIVLIAMNYKLRKNEKFIVLLLILVFIFSFLISVYHFGIEQEFINESSICVTNNADLITKDDILKSLGKVTVNCKNVAFKIFGLSLTTYNMLISVIMFLISLKIYLINNGIKK